MGQPDRSHKIYNFSHTFDSYQCNCGELFDTGEELFAHIDTQAGTEVANKLAMAKNFLMSATRTDVSPAQWSERIVATLDFVIQALEEMEKRHATPET